MSRGLRSLSTFITVSLLLISAFPLISRAADKPPARDDSKVEITPRAKRTEAPADVPHGNIRVESTLVLIPVTVTDPLNRFVTGLDRENFRLFEDKSEQKVTHFASEDAPLSVGLVFFLIQFNDRPEMVVDFTTHLEEIQTRLTFTQSKGRTALLDAVYMALHKMKKAKNPRKALLIISDGGDNSSRYTESEIKNLVREADVQIYAIGIYESMATRGRTPEELSGPSLLTEIAEQTGGRQFSVENLNELPDVAAKIGIELRNQYILGYTPSNQGRDGKYRRVQVKLVQPRGLPPLRAFWRLGYYAPTQ